MKRFLKVLLWITGGLVLLIGGVATYFLTTFPKVGKAPEIRVDLDPERIEHGRYLANSVLMCMDCHSKRDWTKFGGPPTPGSLGGGGDEFGREMGLPGVVRIPNITPYALKNWTDGEILRAITEGISKDGRVLFPIMPYQDYGKLDKQDLLDVIAYLRTIPEVRQDVAQTEIDFPVNYLIRMAAQPASFRPKPVTDDPVRRGKYLVQSSGCQHCHSPKAGEEFIADSVFSGGTAMKLPFGIITPANITSDVETGIGSWTREMFIHRFAQYRDSAEANRSVRPGDFQTIMPWSLYANMTDEDLGAIYSYLKSCKPIHRQVVKFRPVSSPATLVMK